MYLDKGRIDRAMEGIYFCTKRTIKLTVVIIEKSLLTSAYNILLSILLNTICKSKAVPLHAIEDPGGRGGIASTHYKPRH
jgi:hypothetical protein